MADSRYAGEAGLQAVFGQIKAAMAEKQDKINDMGLSHNDYSDEEKQKNAQNASDIASLNNDIDAVQNGLTNLDVALSVPDGAGKNILPLTIDNVKKYVDYAVWSGNSVTIKGVTYTFDVDGNDSVTKIHAEGTATDGDAWLTLYKENTDFGDCILTGCPSGGSDNTYILTAYKSNPSEWYYDSGTGVLIPNNKIIEQVYINIKSGYALPTGGIDFYPMIRLSSVSDSTFVPYIPSVDARLEAVESGLENGQTVSTFTTDADVASAFYGKHNYHKTILMRDTTKTMALLARTNRENLFVTLTENSVIWGNHPNYMACINNDVFVGVLNIGSSSVSVTTCVKLAEES